MQKKIEEWLENGVHLGWLLLPNNEKAFIYRPNQPVEEISDYNRTLSGEEVLPGFILDLKILK